MRAVRFSTQNADLGPPKNDGGGRVAELPCRRVLIPWDGTDGQHVGPAWMSFWRPSERELASLNAGRPLGLMICGAGHPPLTVFVDNAGTYAGEVTGDATATQEDPVAYAWHDEDRRWQVSQAAKATASKLMAGALAGAKEAPPESEDGA